MLLILEEKKFEKNYTGHWFFPKKNKIISDFSELNPWVGGAGIRTPISCMRVRHLYNYTTPLLTRGSIPSGELKKLFELLMKRGATEGGAFHKMPAVNKPVIFLTIFQMYKTLLCRFSFLQFFYSFPKNIFSKKTLSTGCFIVKRKILNIKKC